MAVAVQRGTVTSYLEGYDRALTAFAKASREKVRQEDEVEVEGDDGVGERRCMVMRQGRRRKARVRNQESVQRQPNAKLGDLSHWCSLDDHDMMIDAPAASSLHWPSSASQNESSCW